MKLPVLKYNQVVEWNGEPHVVVATTWYQSRHFRDDAFMIDYCLNPQQYEGFEADEEVWVSEADYLAAQQSRYTDV